MSADGTLATFTWRGSVFRFRALFRHQRVVRSCRKMTKANISNQAQPSLRARDRTLA